MKLAIIIDNSKSNHLSSAENIKRILLDNQFKTTTYYYKKISIKSIFQAYELLKTLLSLKPADVLIFNTISLRSTYWVLISLLVRCKKGFYIRNANIWRYPNKKNLNFTHIIKSYLNFLLRVLCKIDASFFLCGSYNIKKFISKTQNIPTVVVPFASFNNFNDITNTDNKTIVVPGDIDFERKDLDTIIKAFAVAKVDNVKLILLGKCHSKNDKKQIDEWKIKNEVNFHYYKEFISAKEFNKVLRESTAILGSIKNKFIYGGFFEKYGLTKDTGIEAHCIANKKPLIINKSYSVDKYLKKGTFFYDDYNDLASILIQISDNKFIKEHIDYSKFSSNYVNIQFRNLINNLK